MGLLDLPVEIIDRILDASLPSGIQGLALSCRAIYERAAPQLRRHHGLRQKWRRTSNHQLPRVDDTLHILFEISREPLVAEYIEELDLWDDRWRPEGVVEEVGKDDIPEETITPENFRRSRQAMSAIRDMVAKSLQASRANVDMTEFWENMMKEELDPNDASFAESTCTVIVLLSMLPNLQALRLPGWWDGVQKEAGNTLDVLIEGANRDNAQGRPLSQLRTILPSMHDGYEEKTGLQELVPLLSLRSLKEVFLVSAVAVDDGYTGIPFSWPQSVIPSSISHLELVSCCMDAEGLSSLISHTPLLNIFRYSHETKYHGCQHDWNPGTFAEALGRYCGNTITEVALTIDELHGAIVNGASSFHTFSKLEQIEADIEIFCGPPVESGQRQGENAHVPEGETPWTKNDIPCIGSMLPDSIRVVHINVDHAETDEGALRALLKNLKQQRVERLHKLEQVIIRQYGSNNALQVAMNAGATLESFDRGVEEMSMRRKTDMPDWKRKFQARVARLEPREF